VEIKEKRKNKYYIINMEQSLAANNNELIKQILERLIQIENNLAFIQQYINDKKKREEARWW